MEFKSCPECNSNMSFYHLKLLYTCHWCQAHYTEEYLHKLQPKPKLEPLPVYKTPETLAAILKAKAQIDAMHYKDLQKLVDQMMTYKYILPNKYILPTSYHATGPAYDHHIDALRYAYNKPEPTYRERAASEFEGVSGLDESLWNGGESGLL